MFIIVSTGKGGAAGAGLGIAGGMYYGSQQNAKGGGDGAQLAFGSDKCPVSSNAFYCSPSTSSPCDPDARSRRPPLPLLALFLE